MKNENRVSLKQFVVRILGLAVLSSLVRMPSAASATGIEYTSDVSVAVKTQMNLDLDFLASIRGTVASKFHEQIFGDLNGLDYTKWIQERIKLINFVEQNTDGTVAFVLYEIDPTQLFLTPNFVTANSPQIARLMVIIHESRPSEGANNYWPHEPCPSPFVDGNSREIKSIWTGLPLSGQMACDVHAFGSYGVSVIWLENIAKNCTTCTEKVKMDARIYGDDQLLRITDPAENLSLRRDLDLSP